jgi:hypothetical protein
LRGGLRHWGLRSRPLMLQCLLRSEPKKRE